VEDLGCKGELKAEQLREKISLTRTLERERDESIYGMLQFLFTIFFCWWIEKEDFFKVFLKESLLVQCTIHVV